MSKILNPPDKVSISRNTDTATKIIEASGYTYVGKADPGSAAGSAVWQCMRIDETSAGSNTITWADGNTEFDNVLSNITSLSYS